MSRRQKDHNVGKVTAKEQAENQIVSEFKAALRKIGHCPVRGTKIEWATLVPNLHKTARDAMSRTMNKIRLTPQWAQIFQDCGVDDPDAYASDAEDAAPPAQAPVIAPRMYIRIYFTIVIINSCTFFSFGR